MAKFLRIVVIFLLLLSIGALVFGIMLFQKRELLKGRTQKLETTLLNLAPLIEAQFPPEEIPAKPTDARDIDDCRDEVNENPKRSAFWDDYKIELEVPDLARFDLDSRKLQLQTYYKINPITDKPEKDEYGNKLSKGEGTMQALLDEFILKAKEQYIRLNDTRAQLKALREEYVATVQDLNSQKRTLRESLVKITQLEGEIRDLKAKIQELETTIAGLEAKIKELENTIAEKELEIKKRDEVIAQRDVEIQRLKITIQQLSSKDDSEVKFPISAGEKGKIVAINHEYGFVVCEVQDAFLKEVLGTDMNFPIPRDLNLMVYRGDKQFITKVRLRTLRITDRIAVADIMVNWRKSEPAVGDRILY